MYDELIKLISKSKNIVFFGGAGVSTESNIPDFRSADGLHKLKLKGKPKVEKILSATYFNRHPKDFYKFYYTYMKLDGILPNKAHYALTKLEELGRLKAIVTQNIDGLHQEAGSKNVFELHGTSRISYCVDCNEEYNDEQMNLKKKKLPPTCDKCGGIIKPRVVLYEEALDDKTFDESIKAISEADLLIVGGTSLAVYPAAGLLRYYKGKDIVLINKESTRFDDRATLIINDSIGEVLDEVVKHVKKARKPRTKKVD